MDGLAVVALLQVAVLVGLVVATVAVRRVLHHPSTEESSASSGVREPHSVGPASSVVADQNDDAPVTEALVAGEELAVQLDDHDPLLHVSFALEVPDGVYLADDPAVSRLVASLDTLLPVLPRTLPDGYLLARFPAHVSTMLRSGEARLMISQGEQLTRAVSVQTGRVIGSARRVSEGGAAGALVLAGGPAGPILAVAVIAASWYHQRWVDQTLGRIQGTVAAVETRLRDDDLGVLLAATEVAEQYLAVLQLDRETPPLVVHQLAAATLRTKELHRARYRRVDAFLSELDELQDRHEQRRGTSAAWADGVDKLIAQGGRRFVSDACVGIQAALTSAKLQTLASIELALEGQAPVASRQLEETLNGCSPDVHQIARRVGALARSRPRSRLLGSDAEDALGAVEQLHSYLEEGVLTVLPPRLPQDGELRLALPTRSVDPAK